MRSQETWTKNQVNSNQTRTRRAPEGLRGSRTGIVFRPVKSGSREGKSRRFNILSTYLSHRAPPERDIKLVDLMIASKCSTTPLCSGGPALRHQPTNNR